MKYLTATLLCSSLLMSPAQAYYSQTNITEVFGIQPNHSAFWIPGFGDSKNAQAESESEEFLNANKVQSKFFPIPHQKLAGSSYMSWDYYVPSGRLIIVDRSPFFHEWTRAGRGTDSDKDQSFPCHSKDNIRVTAEMSLAASVSEANAAKFLYYFGTKAPKGDPTEPEVIFTSVYYGKDLYDVMGGWGRGEVQSHICREINLHDVGDLGLNGNLILDKIQSEVTEFFAKKGITIEYVGWAGGFGFPPEVETAINTRFAAEHVKPVMDVLERKAVVDALEGWNHTLPTSLTILDVGQSLLESLIKATQTAIPPTK